MSDYLRITWKPSTAYYISQEKYQRMLSEIGEATAQNRILEATKTRQFEQMLALARDLYGSSSEVIRYLKRKGVPKAPSHAKVLRALYLDYEAGRSLERRRISRAATAEKRKILIEALEANGYVIDRDFRKSNAISFAKRNLRFADGRWVRRVPVLLLPERVE